MLTLPELLIRWSRGHPVRRSANAQVVLHDKTTPVVFLEHRRKNPDGSPAAVVVVAEVVVSAVGDVAFLQRGEA